MIAGMDKWQFLFFLCAALVVLFQVVSGWRRGLVRQMFNILGIVMSYFVGVLCGKFAVPVLRPMGYPDFVTNFIAGALLALITMVVVSSIGALLFKKTSQQSVGLVRFFYGVSGAVLGGGVGLFMIWVALIGTRLLGTVAESEMHPARHSADGKRAWSSPTKEPTAVVRGLAEMKHSLDQSAAAPLVEKVDPIPVNVYSILGKVVRMASDSDAVDRFVQYPGAKPLEENPTMVALGKDPEIVAAIRTGNYFSLLKNKSIAEAVNDPKVAALVKNFELEKALDYALNTSGSNSKRAPVNNPK